ISWTTIHVIASERIKYNGVGNLSVQGAAVADFMHVFSTSVKTQINGNGGEDTIVMASDPSTPSSVLDRYKGALSFDGGADTAPDHLVIGGDGTTHDAFWLVQGNQVQRIDGPAIQSFGYT